MTQATIERAQVRAKLEQAIERGKREMPHVLERVLGQVPQDYIVPGRALTFEVPDQNALVLQTPERSWPTHQNARRQLFERAGVPQGYGENLLGGDPWQRSLLEHVLRETYQHGSRYLVRTVEGEARAVLSDKFRRLDVRPLLEAFATAAQGRGAVPYTGTVTELRAAVKVLLPEVFEIGGDFVAYGLEWGNSDFGHGANEVRELFLRLWCLNGAVGFSLGRMVHLGARLQDDITYSSETYRLDNEAACSALRDIVGQRLSEDGLRDMRARLTSAMGEGLTWPEARGQLTKALSRVELQDAERRWESDEVEMLPAGHTVWRMSNVLSWMARDATPERRLELEKLAGVFVAPGKN